MTKRRLLPLFLLVALLLSGCGTGEGDMPTFATAIREPEGENEMAGYDFSAFPNVNISGIDFSSLSEEQLVVLYQQAHYCQAMTEADTDTMGEIVSEDHIFTHMSGRQQAREEYFADVRDGSLTYFSIGMENPVVEVNDGLACVTYTSILDANAYGASGTYRMEGTHWFEKCNGVWYFINTPDNTIEGERQ